MREKSRSCSKWQLYVEGGKAHEYVRNGSTTYSSDHAIVNPSGGLISKGHRQGPTGLAQCAELVWQLRGRENNRLVSVPARNEALQQNAGLGGACVVTVLKRADGLGNEKVMDAEVRRLRPWDIILLPKLKASRLSKQRKSFHVDSKKGERERSSCTVKWRLLPGNIHKALPSRS